MAIKDHEVETPPVEDEVQVPCEIYSRIVGYLRPVQNWHQGKQQEFHDRRTFHVPEAPVQGTAQRAVQGEDAG